VGDEGGPGGGGSCGRGRGGQEEEGSRDCAGGDPFEYQHEGEQSRYVR